MSQKQKDESLIAQTYHDRAQRDYKKADSEAKEKERLWALRQQLHNKICETEVAIQNAQTQISVARKSLSDSKKAKRAKETAKQALVEAQRARNFVLKPTLA